MSGICEFGFEVFRYYSCGVVHKYMVDFIFIFLLQKSFFKIVLVTFCVLFAKQMCGNGIRCVAKYLAELEKAPAPKRYFVLPLSCLTRCRTYESYDFEVFKVFAVVTEFLFGLGLQLQSTHSCRLHDSRVAGRWAGMGH